MINRRSVCNRFQAGVSAAAIALAMTVATPAWAQTDSANLEGHVDGATAGTQVIVTDTNTGQKSVATVDASGNYIILGLRPSSYTVSVDGKPAQNATLLVGQTAVVNFVDESAGGKDIIVNGRPGVSIRTPAVTTNITPLQIETLPQNQRNFLSFAALAPGVSVTRGGNSQIQAGATSASNVNVLLDGISIKNPINHGGVFGQNFGLGNPFPQIAVQEYQVTTQNFGAETGQAGSALLTAVTKTGGDSFHGSAFIEFQPNSFITQPYFDKKNGVPKPDYNRKQFGGDFSGPIIPDVLTFYVAGEGTIENLPGTTGVLPSTGIQLPNSIKSQILVPHNFDFHQGLYFGKLTLFATPNDTFNFSAFIRKENNLSDVDANAAASHGRTILTHEDRYQLNWRHSSGAFLNVLNISYDKATQSTPSVGTGPEYVISNGTATDFSTLALLGAHSFNQGDTQKTWTIKDDATWRLGQHTLKAGFQVVTLDLTRTVSNHFNGSYFYTNPGPNGTLDLTSPYGAQINVQPTPSLSGNDVQIGFYAQDEWRPDEHWTINYGLRWDFETNANNNSYVTPTAIATALRNYPGWKAAGINAEDYISTGNNRKPQYDEFQPRLGFSYDFGGDQKTVIFGGAGRYFDRSLFIEGVIESLTNSNNIVTYNFNGACSGGSKPAYCTDPAALRTFLQSSSTAGGDVFVLNNKTKMPFSDQFDLGIRHRFGDVTVSLTYSHVRSHNIFQFVRANYYENGWYTRIVTRDLNGNVTGCSNGGNAWIQDLSPGSLTNGDGSAVSTAICAAQNAQLAGHSGKLNIGSANGKAVYNALYLTVEKPFTKTNTWGIQSSLTFQLARTNDQQELNSDEFYNGTSQDVYGWGWVNGVEKWRLVTAAQYRAPLGVVLSGNLTLSSGPAFGHIVAPWNGLASAPDGACCYGNLGGAYYPKPFIAYKRLDLRVEKTFTLPWGNEVSVDFEAFNVFNWLNRNYSSWGAGGGNPPPFVEDSQVGNDARSFQAGIKYKF